MLVIASLSPVFIIWAILGNEKIPDIYFIPTCLLFVLIPHFVILSRIRVAKKEKNFSTIKIHSAKDCKEQLLTYFLPLILPLMAVSFQSWRVFAATMVILAIMAFASWHLGIFYLNLFFALFGYRIYQINNNECQSSNQVLISKRSCIHSGKTIKALQLGSNIFYEHKPNKTDVL